MGKIKDGSNCLEYDNVGFVGKLSFICLKVINYMYYINEIKNRGSFSLHCQCYTL